MQQNIMPTVHDFRSFQNEAKANALYKADIDKSYDVGAQLSLLMGVFGGVVSFVAQFVAFCRQPIIF